MGTKTGISLKVLQLLWRGLTLGCGVVVVGIYGYFLATMHTHSLYISTWVRAVEALAGIISVYSLIGVLLLWCVAGHTLASFFAIFLDILMIAAFIYIAAANHGGAGTCSGGRIKTPFGTGDSSTTTSTNSSGTIIKLPSFHTACKLETATLAVSVLGIIFFICAAITELLLQKNHKREKAFGPGPNNGYTSGSGKRKGLFGRKRQDPEADAANGNYDPNALPAGTTAAEAEVAATHHNGKYGNPQQNY